LIKFTVLHRGGKANANAWGIRIDRRIWRTLSAPQKVAMVAHELRHVYQKWGLICGIPLATVAAVLAAGAIRDGLWEYGSLLILLAVHGALWFRITLRAYRDPAWAELDADQFAYFFSPSGITSFRKKKGRWVPSRGRYRPAIQWLKSRARKN
jgi:hypothetical protein